MKVLGKRFKLDVFEAETADKIEQGLKRVQAACADLAEEASVAESIRLQCACVFEFLDDVLGEGTSNKLFGGRTSLTLCLDAFEAVIREVNAQRRAMMRRHKKETAGFWAFVRRGRWARKA